MNKVQGLLLILLTIGLFIALSCGGGGGGGAAPVEEAKEEDEPFNTLDANDITDDSTLGISYSGSFVLATIPEGMTYQEARDIILKNNGIITGYDSFAKIFQVQIPTDHDPESYSFLMKQQQGELAAAPVFIVGNQPIESGNLEKSKWDKFKVRLNKRGKTITNDYGTWDGAGSQNWALRFIELHDAWDMGRGKNSIKVGVLDRDIEEHQDLKFEEILDFRNSDIFNSHGMHVSGTIAADTNNSQGISGVSWDIGLIAFDGAVSSYKIDISLGFSQLISKGSKIINCSFDSHPGSNIDSNFINFYNLITKPYYKNLVTNLLNQQPQTLFIQAAGNNSADAFYSGALASVKDDFPDNIIVVAAIDSTGNLAWYSNFGDVVDVAAPGSHIYSTVKDGYEFRHGTSMATPHVSGLAALLWSLDESFTAKQVKDFIVEGAKRGGKTAVSVSDPQFRQVPIINAHESLWLARKFLNDNQAPLPTDQNVSTNEDTALPITLSSVDTHEDTSSYQISQNPTNGTLTGVPPFMIYTPNQNYNGQDSFSFTASDWEFSSLPGTVSINVLPVNDPPVSISGEDQTIIITSSASLSGTSSYDIDGDSMIYFWSKEAGEGNVIIGDTSAVSTTASIDALGNVVLRLSVSDGQVTHSDNLTVTVVPAVSGNAPLVDAGEDLIGIVGSSLLLSGNVSDDNLPSADLLNIEWSMLSGPVNPVFTTSSSAQSYVTFSSAGNYVLELHADDAIQSTKDTINVEVINGFHLLTGTSGNLLRLDLSDLSVATVSSNSLIENAQNHISIAQDGSAYLSHGNTTTSGANIILVNPKTGIQSEVISGGNLNNPFEVIDYSGNIFVLDKGTLERKIILFEEDFEKYSHADDITTLGWYGDRQNTSNTGTSLGGMVLNGFDAPNGSQQDLTYYNVTVEGMKTVELHVDFYAIGSTHNASVFLRDSGGNPLGGISLEQSPTAKWRLTVYRVGAPDETYIITNGSGLGINTKVESVVSWDESTKVITGSVTFGGQTFTHSTTYEYSVNDATHISINNDHRGTDGAEMDNIVLKGLPADPNEMTTVFKEDFEGYSNNQNFVDNKSWYGDNQRIFNPSTRLGGTVLNGVIAPNGSTIDITYHDIEFENVSKVQFTADYYPGTSGGYTTHNAGIILRDKTLNKALGGIHFSQNASSFFPASWVFIVQTTDGQPSVSEVLSQGSGLGSDTHVQAKVVWNEEIKVATGSVTFDGNTYSKSLSYDFDLNTDARRMMLYNDHRGTDGMEMDNIVFKVTPSSNSEIVYDDSGKVLVYDKNTQVLQKTFSGNTIGDQPRGLLLEPSGNLLLANMTSGDIVRLNPDTSNTSVVYNHGDFRSPISLSLVGSNDLYVADTNGFGSGNQVVFKVDLSGNTHSVVSQGQNLSSISDILLAPDGFLYVTDQTNGIIKVNPLSGEQTQLKTKAGFDLQGRPNDLSSLSIEKN